MTKSFTEVISGIRTAKKGVEVREDLAQMGEYCQQFTQEAGRRADAARDAAKGYADNAKASEEKATQTVQGIDQTKADAVSAVNQAKETALKEVASSTTAASTAAQSANASKDAAEKSASAAAASESTASSQATNAAGSASAAANSATKANADAARAEKAAGNAAAIVSTDKTLTVSGAPADAEAVGNAVKNAILAAHPVGSLFWSANPTSPASLFGGTWERIKDVFVLAAGDTYAAGSTGGNATHTHDVSGNASIGVVQNTTAYDSSGAKISEEFPIGLFAHTHEYDSIFDSSNAFYSTMSCVKTKGSANEQSNIPPYVAMYVWKRIA